MGYDILKMKKFRVNKWDPPFSNKPKLYCLFVLIVMQLTLHIGCLECRK